MELARKKGDPIDPECSKWLEVALKKIACGADAEEALDVKPHKTERKDYFRQECQRKVTQAFVSSASDQFDPERLTVKKSIEAAATIFENGPVESTVRKTWNSEGAERKPVFTLSR
jgi:hypothetical protein